MIAVNELMVNETGFAHSFKAGDVLYGTWGYDQTNVDFYVVTRVSAKSVWVVTVGSFYSETGWACGYSTPNLQVRGNIEYRLSAVDKNGNGRKYLNDPFHSFSAITQWDGKPVYESHYC